MTGIIVLTIVGAGVVTGLLFAFSNFVMTALAEVPNLDGMRVMQRINERIINPIFVVLFMGTPVLCAIITVKAVMDLESHGNLVLLLGSLSYLVGPFGITMLFNVPLNNRLANTELAEADHVWTDYQIRWQRWNHIRTYIGVASIALLAAGLAHS